MARCTGYSLIVVVLSLLANYLVAVYRDDMSCYDETMRRREQLNKLKKWPGRPDVNEQVWRLF